MRIEVSCISHSYNNIFKIIDAKDIFAKWMNKWMNEWVDEGVDKRQDNIGGRRTF